MSLNRITLALASLIACSSAVPVTAQQPRATRAGNEPSASGNSSYASDPWHQTLHDFDEWTQIQRLYSKQQVTEMRGKILDKIVSLPTEDSERFRDEINAKLHVMMSAEARDARKWLNDTLAVASDSYAAKI